MYHLSLNCNKISRAVRIFISIDVCVYNNNNNNNNNNNDNIFIISQYRPIPSIT